MFTHKKSIANTSACIAVAATTVLSGCETVSSTRPLTTEEKIVRCGAMVVGSALLGAAIGNNTGDGDSKDGAKVGALIGGGACAVWLAFENAADKKRLAAARDEALRDGNVITTSWKGEDGRERSVHIMPSEETPMIEVSTGPSAPPLATQPRICRKINTTATVQGRSETHEELWCRDENGDYAPATKEMALV